MAYQKQNFANGNTLSASELIHIENGIVALEEELNNAKQELVNEVITAIPVAEGASF